ncbi:hypothetical protein [Holdemania massiliensis]|uniref:hypothetical protein n=1 Tax=Holdemania massiliensis TaxID=1468449 RepID=UPI0002F78A73|nr:hypothetical protein [Holdemania massiliensis]
MNIKELIQLVKRRPGMFIGDLKLEYLYHFINGFLFNNISTSRADEIDEAFKREFHQWVREWIKENKNIEFDEDRNYLYYIQEVCKSQEQCFTMFFELAEEYFKEL